VDEEETITVSFESVGYPLSTVSYQWSYRASPSGLEALLEGETTNSYTFDVSQSGGQVRCTVTIAANGVGPAAIGQTAWVSVVDPNAPTITDVVLSSPIVGGGPIECVVSASGTGTLNYTFQRQRDDAGDDNFVDDGSPVDNGSSATLTTTADASAWNGDQIRYLVTVDDDLGTSEYPSNAVSVTERTEYSTDTVESMPGAFNTESVWFATVDTDFATVQRVELRDSSYDGASNADEIIRIVHDMPGWGQSAEAVAWNASTRALTLDTPFEWGGGLYIMLRARDGSPTAPILASRGAARFINDLERGAGGGRACGYVGVEH
jgi:hypothetical protein